MSDAFPDNWLKALVIMPHPDDPEYGMSAAVSRWTREGKVVEYLFGTSGEAGIAGMDPAEAGPLREQEQIAAGDQVGVAVVEFMGQPDGKLANTPELRAAIVTEIDVRHPDVIVTTYTGSHYMPDIPNQPDHIEFGNAVLEAAKEASHQVGWVFEAGPGATHFVEVDERDIERAIASLAEHRVYLEVLDPDTPVIDQATAQVRQTVVSSDGRSRVGLKLVWSRESTPL